MPLDQEQEHFPYEKNMSFFDHIDELRRYLVRMAIIILVSVVIAFFGIDFLFQKLILGPFNQNFIGYQFYCKLGQILRGSDFLCFQPPVIQMQSTAIQGQFLSAFKIAFVAGFIISFPLLVFQLWLFIKPALSLREIKRVYSSLFVVCGLFFLGLAFSYILLVPLATNFLLNFKLAPQIQNIITIQSVTGFVCYMSLAGGLVFELPVLIYILARIGLINSAFLIKYWRYAIIIIFIIAGIATPSPDVFSQLVLAMPLMLLYVVGVLVTKRVEKNNELKEN